MGIVRVIVVLFRAFLFPRAALGAEILALRHQLGVFQRTVRRPRLRQRDRILWVWLSRFWTDWRSSLLIVKPETVVCWHREGDDPMSLLNAAREAVWSVNRNLPLARVRTLDEYVDRSMARTSFTLVMLGISALVALFLGSVGIYGVISYVVSQRTREIGVRMAIGAEAGDVSRMVLKQALMLAGGGVVIGLVGAAGLTRLMSSLLFGVSSMDPVTFGSVALGLSAVALLASYLPARRAAKVDPVVALRFE